MLSERLCKDVAAGILEMPLVDCELRQRASDAPTVYRGPGLLTLDSDGRLHVRLFAEPPDMVEALRREWNVFSTPGKLVPESAYFDFSCRDEWGETWSATHVAPDTSFGAGTYVQFKPRRIQKAVMVERPDRRPTVAAFVPGELDLPWHETTRIGEHGFRVDRFVHECERFRWHVRKHEGSTWLSLNSAAPGIEHQFNVFRQALSIALGRTWEPRVIALRDDGIEITRIQDRFENLGDARLWPIVDLQRPESGHVHQFVAAFFSEGTRSGSSPAALIYRLWHRVLRARESDIENSSLVLSVAIEGLVREVLHSDADVDCGFVSDLKRAKGALRKAELAPRVRHYLLSSLGHAKRPRISDVFRRLASEGTIAQEHIEAWRDMRNAAAHGASMDWEAPSLQVHIDRYRLCLDLFYRIVLLAIGFQGIRKDYSLPGWPSTSFPPPARLGRDASLEEATEG